MPTLPYLTLLFAFFITSFQSFAQTLHLSGDIRISVKEGVLEADVMLSNLPSTDDYSIWLNAGLNIRYFRDSTDTFNYYIGKYYESEDTYEGFQYFLPTNDGKGMYLPKALRINYKGAFPVVSDTLKAYDRGDWKGNIAFNGTTIRATEQSVWYPVLNDKKANIVHSSVTYDLKITCLDCISIYLNGNLPSEGNVATLKTETAVPLVLFAGDFTYQKTTETYYINGNLSDTQLEKLDGWIEKITAYYEDQLKMPYGSPITLVSTTPITKKNKWMFVTYPTIAMVGYDYGFADMFDASTEDVSTNALSTIAHELGHYYFGTVLNPNSSLKWIFLEGFTEYLALQAGRDLLGDTFYKARLQRYASITKNKEGFKRLSQIEKESEIGEMFRYNFTPLLLTALEQKVGREVLWSFLREALSHKNPLTDYTFLTASLTKAGIDLATFETIERDLLENTEGLDKVLRTFE